MPEWVVFVLATVPLMTFISGAAGVWFTFRVQARNADSAKVTSQAAADQATIAGAKVAVDEMAELRQHWEQAFKRQDLEMAAVRSDNQRIAADLAALNAVHQQDKQAHMTEMRLMQQKLGECEALNLAMLVWRDEVNVRVHDMEQAGGDSNARDGS